MDELMTREERFWAKVDKTDECWLWTAAQSDTGYGTFWNGRVVLVHRTVYEEVHGPIPEGHHLHHTCENRLCVNVEHLQLVTPGEHLRLHRGAAVCPHCGSTRPRIQGWRNGKTNGTRCRDCVNRKRREKALTLRARECEETQ